MGFTHLHVHTQYSILDGASSIPALMKKAKEDEMKAIAITDHGNLFGAKEFCNEAKSHSIKPILGCEVYVARRSRFKNTSKEDRGGYHLILLAKNHTGYRNLVKLVSAGWIEGHYYKPRIDKEILKEYSDGLIASTACLGGDIPSQILNESASGLEASLAYYLETFGDDFYLELQRHPTGDPFFDDDTLAKQKKVNTRLMEIALDKGIKLIATNDVHFVNQEDAEAHDRLICLNTGKDLDDPTRMRYTKQEWFKTREEMAELYADIPQALENTQEIADKIEYYDLNHDPIMPDFPIPDEYEDADDYLYHLTMEGARNRYGDITDDLQARIDYELGVIKKMGFPGYFLIVQDFLDAARKMDVSVGPGRGSAAGSVVAYCNRITDIDPIKYDLLFERFLNPDRISMPDIDIDFDEDGREDVLRYVVDKYGKNKVAHIITFGTMAAKMAIRDVARIEKLPLPEADKLAKLVPERPGTTLKKAYAEVRELNDIKLKGTELAKRTLKYAEILEGSVRHTGLHACGIIIGKDDLMEHIPVCKSKDTDLWVTQFDGKHVGSVGMLKMDFLGLKTLSIIKDAVEMIKVSKGADIDIGNLPLDDKKTFELYSRGETTGLFQFESDGMKRYLRELKPNRFEDLIAMNALYRPGPMEYIPRFIKRKHGKEKIQYDLPQMEKFLKDTYGITVYQEQVMLLSQEMAGFTGGQADSLRKAMGKKNSRMMADLNEKFIEGCAKNDIQQKDADKIWKDWMAFAEYAFNKSHSTCYALVSYQTAWLKAHYPAEFMASVLSRNINDIKKITQFMNECRRMGLSVLGPDVNESRIKFAVNAEGNIRFGLGAIKGLGAAAASRIIQERDENGAFSDIYAVVERVDLQAVNKKSLEALAGSGALDSLGDIMRGQYFGLNTRDISFIERLIRYGHKIQAERMTTQQSLFGEANDLEISKPVITTEEAWPKLVKLDTEKELIGIYLSAHPLDSYKLEIEHFCTHSLSNLDNLGNLNGQEVMVAGLVRSHKQAYTKNNKPYGTIILEDYTDSLRLMLFNKDYIAFKNYFTPGYALLIRGQVQPRPFNNGTVDYELKIKEIKMLADVREEMISSLIVTVALSSLDEQMINEIDKYAGQKNGSTRLKFLVHDREENIYIEMFSRTKRIQIDDELIQYLQEKPEIDFKFN
ncbi:MAG: DNA polymerase III subunit alpha [Bacteroidales bacterium]